MRKACLCFITLLVIANSALADGTRIDNWPAIQPISGNVGVTNFPASQAVTGTFFQATQPVSGSVSVGNFPATQPVSGAVSVSNLPATQPVSGSVSVTNFPVSQPVTGSFFQATQPVSLASMPTTPVTGTFWQATQPVSGTLGISNFPASQAVTGTFWQTTQPVSIASMPSTPVTGSFWQATQPVSIAAMPSTPVTGTFWQATQPISGTVGVNNFPASQTVAGTVSVGNFPATQAVSIASMPSTPVTGTFFQTTQPVSLGNSTGKALIGKIGSLATSAVTADQVVVTYTVTAGKTLYLEWMSCNARLTTFAATATLFGTCSLETPSGTKIVTDMLAGSGIGDRDVYTFTEPLPVAAGAVIRIVTTPAAVTAMTWQGNFGGYEK